MQGGVSLLLDGVNRQAMLDQKLDYARGSGTGREVQGGVSMKILKVCDYPKTEQPLHRITMPAHCRLVDGHASEQQFDCSMVRPPFQQNLHNLCLAMSGREDQRGSPFTVQVNPIPFQFSSLSEQQFDHTSMPVHGGHRQRGVFPLIPEVQRRTAGKQGTADFEVTP